jgi:hypothetical protein
VIHTRGDCHGREGKAGEKLSEKHFLIGFSRPFRDSNRMFSMWRYSWDELVVDLKSELEGNMGVLIVFLLSTILLQEQHSACK